MIRPPSCCQTPADRSPRPAPPSRRRGRVVVLAKSSKILLLSSSRIPMRCPHRIANVRPYAIPARHRVCRRAVNFTRCEQLSTILFTFAVAIQRLRPDRLRRSLHLERRHVAISATTSPTSSGMGNSLRARLFPPRPEMSMMSLITRANTCSASRRGPGCSSAGFQLPQAMPSAHAHVEKSRSAGVRTRVTFREELRLTPGSPLDVLPPEHSVGRTSSAVPGGPFPRRRTPVSGCKSRSFPRLGAVVQMVTTPTSSRARKHLPRWPRRTPSPARDPDPMSPRWRWPRLTALARRQKWASFRPARAGRPRGVDLGHRLRAARRDCSSDDGPTGPSREWIGDGVEIMFRRSRSARTSASTTASVVVLLYLLGARRRS